MTIQCEFCQKEFKNSGGRGVHYRFCKDNPSRNPYPRSPLAGKKKGSIAWNKGMTMPPEYGKVISDAMKKSDKLYGRASTPEKEIERKRKISVAAKKNNGGYRRGSGRGKKGWYKGFWCDSSYELAFIIYHIDHGIPISRCAEIRQYEFEGKIRNYHPDFIVDGKIVELKGYSSDQWESKIKSNPDIVVLFGKDYIKLYETRRGNQIGD